MQTLIVGCSFVHNLKFHPRINTDRYALFGSSGASNQSIAARVKHQLATQHYKKVVVLWSGINRLSVCWPTQADKFFDYEFKDTIGSTTWYHSGGIGCSGEQSSTPELLRQYFRTQYLMSDAQYLTDLSMRSILDVQALLKSLDIPGYMSFIYDINDHRPSQHEVSHGAVDTNCSLVQKIDWSMFKAQQPPWEWAAARNELYEQDQYHPTPDSLCNWFRQNLSIDLLT